MRVLLAGGGGFLGSHLSKELIKRGYHVIVIDNFSTGKLRNIQSLMQNINFEYRNQDVREKFAIQVDGVFNFASPASPIHYQKSPIDTLTTNVLGTYNLLTIAHQNRARYLQASTSEIYGSPIKRIQDEKYWGNVNPIGPRACYDEGKRAAETLIADFYREFQLNFRIARIFNTFGPQMSVDDGRVVSNFIIQALKGRPITVYGEGNQTRSFCFVDDLIEGIIRMFEYEVKGEPINLGNPNPISMIKLAKLIIEMTNSNSKIEHHELPEDDPIFRQPDISKARDILNWEPKISLHDGLKKTIEYFSKELKI